MKKPIKLIIPCMLLSLISCSSMETDTTNKAAVIDATKDEIEIGREMSAKLLGHFGTYDKNPEAEEYLNLVGQSLTRWGSRPELPFHFAILDHDEVNAFATPGGFIFVTRGLMAETESESELAGILAHEIVHVNDKHMYNEIVSDRKITAQETMARFLSRGNSDIAKSISQAVNKGLKMLLEQGMGKEKETAADINSLFYVTSAGYDPKGLITFLKRLEQNKKKVKLAKTAAPIPDRIVQLEKALNEHGFTTLASADNTAMAARFTTALANLREPVKGKK